jgi:hypothetical protein
MVIHLVVVVFCPTSADAVSDARPASSVTHFPPEERCARPSRLAIPGIMLPIESFNKNALHSPNVPAVAEFRKLI